MDELSAFVAVAETSSFTAAAKVVGRDATILSRRLTQLEARLGVQLLSRTTRQVNLTEVGALYYQSVRALLDDLDCANQEATNFASTPQGLLRISLPVTFGRRWIAPLLPTFMDRYPNIRVDARYADRHVDVVAEGFDVAIRVGALRDNSLVAHQIAPYRNLLYAAPSYLAAHGQPRTPEELVEFSCLGFTNHSTWPDWVLKQGTQRRTVRPTGPLVSDSSEALLQAAIAGIGIIFMPTWLVAPSVRSGELVQLLPDWQGSEERGVYVVMPPGRLIPSKTRLFVDEITRAILGGWDR
ncbi:LysR family transcriptional regulator [Pseudomonas fluorescens]|uniref:LysR family transcriptional regulator n=1 Tax=Pseudomonas fluorescens TaxID=294 RepID=UPI0021ACE375|nr:LysR family transcriptional regulator [Pseudomonas fluorescens]